MCSVPSMNFRLWEGYDDLCGNKTFLELVATINTLVINFVKKDLLSELENGAKGRIKDLGAIRQELSKIRPCLEASQEVMDHIWRTTDYLRESISALENQVQRLEKEERVQAAHRKRYTDRLPREVIGSILAFVPSHNMLDYTHNVYIDGILMYAVCDPSSLLPYCVNGRLEWIKMSVLDDMSLANSLVLRAEINPGSLKDLLQTLRSTKAFHRLRSLRIRGSGSFDLDELIRTWPPHLEELYITDGYKTVNDATPSHVDCTSLKVLETRVGNLTYSMWFKSSLTKLTLSGLGHDKHRKYELSCLVHMLAQLSYLEELCFTRYFCGDNLDGVAKIRSASLRSLCFIEPNSNLLELFADCHITRLAINVSDLLTASKLFSHAKDIGIWTRDYESNLLGILYESDSSGVLAFPELEKLGLKGSYYTSMRFLWTDILCILRTRASNPSVRSIKYLELQDKKFSNEGRRYLRQIEELVPILVLTE